jgi:two-component system sensor histidine kinase UhpB
LEVERRESARRALAAQEEERRRVARDLHDEVGQGLTAVMLVLERAVRRADAPDRPELTEARETVRDMLDEVGDIARRLRPEALDDLGLASALTALASRFAEQSGVPVRRSIDAELAARLGPEEEVVVYRVAQEALTNVARHALAFAVELTLEPGPQPGQAVLVVRDDGRGISDDEVESRGGIRGMHERALLVGGRLTVAQRPEGGTEVGLTVPIGGEVS